MRPGRKADLVRVIAKPATDGCRLLTN